MRASHRDNLLLRCARESAAPGISAATADSVQETASPVHRDPWFRRAGSERATPALTPRLPPRRASRWTDWPGACCDADTPCGGWLPLSLTYTWGGGGVN